MPNKNNNNNSYILKIVIIKILSLIIMNVSPFLILILLMISIKHIIFIINYRKKKMECKDGEKDWNKKRPKLGESKQQKIDYSNDDESSYAEDEDTINNKLFKYEKKVEKWKKIKEEMKLKKMQNKKLHN